MTTTTEVLRKCKNYFLFRQRKNAKTQTGIETNSNLFVTVCDNSADKCRGSLTTTQSVSQSVSQRAAPWACPSSASTTVWNRKQFSWLLYHCTAVLHSTPGIIYFILLIPWFINRFTYHTIILASVRLPLTIFRTEILSGHNSAPSRWHTCNNNSIGLGRNHGSKTAELTAGWVFFSQVNERLRCPMKQETSGIAIAIKRPLARPYKFISNDRNFLWITCRMRTPAYYLSISDLDDQRTRRTNLVVEFTQPKD